jgi:hypothetical protein
MLYDYKPRYNDGLNGIPQENIIETTKDIFQNIHINRLNC